MYSLIIKCPRMDHQLWYFRFLTMLICLKNQATFVSFFPNEAELKTHITFYPGYWFWMCFKLQIVLLDLEITDMFRWSAACFFPAHTIVNWMCFCLTWCHMVAVVTFSHSLPSHVWDCISTSWRVNVLAYVTAFHCSRHRISYYFPHSFCTLAFCKSVSAQSDSPPAWWLTFLVKEPYC